MELKNTGINPESVINRNPPRIMIAAKATICFILSDSKYAISFFYWINVVILKKINMNKNERQ